MQARHLLDQRDTARQDKKGCTLEQNWLVTVRAWSKMALNDNSRKAKSHAWELVALMRKTPFLILLANMGVRLKEISVKEADPDEVG